MTTKKLLAIILFLLALAILACGVVGVLVYSFLRPTQVITSTITTSEDFEAVSVTPQPGANSPRATPVSQQPAAGICASAEGDYAVLEISGEMPSPRCMIAYPHQRLRIINRSDAALTASLGIYELNMQPGEEWTIEAELGSYLLPGVHEVSTSSYTAPSLWLQND